VYKGAKFSLRTVEEVVSDLKAMKKVYGDAPHTVFLQDANPLLTRPDDLVEIVTAIRSTFPKVDRITAYARSHTLARRSPEDLKRIREAGLDRLHVGMESGCDDVLELVSKGSSREEMIRGGRRAREAGFELSEYIMPGLGGTALSDRHADESASALVEIEPDFIRLRTTAVIPGTRLAEMEEEGEFEPLSEVALVREIRRLLAGLENLETRIESDHMLNLLMEIRGDLPRDLDRLVGICDSFLELAEKEQQRFILARRLNLVTHLDQRRLQELGPDLDRVFVKVEEEGGDAEQLFHELRKRMV
jgi:coproporphyrinogen III oxidase-like Fe-S oxidoreductase